MVKILLVSDSHGLEMGEELFKFERADRAFHMGDSELYLDNPDLQIFDSKVRGNCDFFNSAPITAFPEVLDLKFFLTHGDRYYVKYDSSEIIYAAKSENCQVIIHGHTHVVRAEIEEDILILNPGSLCLTRCAYPESYMVLNIDNHNIQVELKSRTTRKVLEEWRFSRALIS